jgi:transcriptional regulator with PAS, ATPase and Fis domain
MEITQDWGTIIVDEHGKLVDASADLCENFRIKKENLVGVSIDRIIQRASNKNRNKVFYGIIFGYSCLIRVSHTNSHKTYRILVRQEDIDSFEVVSFMNSLNPEKEKKRESGQNRYSFDEIIGESSAMKKVKELAARIATSNSTVLLTGESGTGKELFAQAIHGLSTRKNNPFVAVNCAAIPDELFESELFGYEAGAFSGAKREGKPGKIELAQNGTLFLDEISELPYQMQGKLLRVLQEREVERLGGTGSKDVDIRIITATNRDLRILVEEGKFRQDLFFRLFVFELSIPPLRKREEDILLLAHSFMDYYNEKFRKAGEGVKYIDAELTERLLIYAWPGNVRELKAYIERGMHLVTGETLTLSDLYVASKKPTATIKQENKQESTVLESLEEEVQRAEMNAIQRTLEAANGDRTLAAQKLKIHIASLYRKIAKYNLK